MLDEYKAVSKKEEDLINKEIIVTKRKCEEEVIQGCKDVQNNEQTITKKMKSDDSESSEKKVITMHARYIKYVDKKI